jgi:5,10-methylenetetrahydromethanopterin reductase
MDYGIVVPTYIDMWREVQAAEEAGFTHAWFPDSQLIWSDCYAAMALAAEKTSRIKLGTLVSIPSNRIAPVTASAVATINKLAPGRVVLSIGTGYTGRNTMGLPSYPVAAFREYAQQVRGLLDGEDVLFREGERERWIRLIHAAHADFINLEDPIPIFLAANGPKAMAVVGELGEGWVVSGGGPWIADGFRTIEGGAQAVGRAYSKPYTVLLEGACVLREGETMSSPRVVDRVGPWAILSLHTMWEASYGRWGSHLQINDADLAGEYHRYISDYAAAKGHAADRLYLDVHEGHFSYLKDGEERFVDPKRIAAAVTGSGPEIIAKVEVLEGSGVDHIALSAHSREGARELIEDFSREVIAKTAR